VVGYHSVCGGLPAPQFADNPLGYKFSWNPRGVLTAGTHDARFRRDGEIVEIAGTNLFKDVPQIQVDPCFLFEVVPNRNSMPYAKSYGLQDAPNMFRGTLRYRGFSDISHSFKLVGLLNGDKQDYLAEDAAELSWRSVMKKILSASDDNLNTKLLERVCSDGYLKPGSEKVDAVLRAYKWLGMLDDTVLVKKKGTLVDSFCALLQKKLAYQHHEIDMVVLQHTFTIEWSDKSVEKRVARLLVFGDNEISAMSKTVGVPVGITVMLLLDGTIKRKGVLAPMSADVYEPILTQLPDYDIAFAMSHQRSAPKE